MDSSLPSKPDVSWCQRKAAYWRAHCERWMEVEKVLRIRFEDVLKSPAKTIDGLSRHFGEPAVSRRDLVPPKLKGRWHSRWNRLCSIRPASTEIFTEKQAVTPEEIFSSACCTVLEDEAGDLMQKFHYPSRL